MRSITVCISVHVALIGLLSPDRPAGACTTFATEVGNELIVGKSYDWHTGDGLLVVNQRQRGKQALVDPQTGLQPARWVSRHGSVTFNQYGRELPLGGMNERGLVIEIMWLEAARYGKPVAGRPTVNELQWIQLLLDTTATVPEAIAAARELQVAKVYGAVHYLACDRSGACATFEHLDGRLRIHQGKRLPVRALTNDTYASSVAYLRRHVGFGGKKPVAAGSASLDRFVRVAALARRGPPSGRQPAQFGFDLLRKVQNGTFTQWQIVYRPRRGLVDFRQRGEARALTIDLGQLSFACDRAVRIMDLKGTVLGARGRWTSYAARHNLELLRINLAALKAPFPPEAIRQLAAYPDQATRCVKQAAR